jgi:hypothetical protein
MPLAPAPRSGWFSGWLGGVVRFSTLTDRLNPRRCGRLKLRKQHLPRVEGFAQAFETSEFPASSFVAFRIPGILRLKQNACCVTLWAPREVSTLRK